MNITGITGVRTAVVEVKTAFTGLNNVMTTHFLVEFSDREYSIIKGTLYSECKPYKWWLERRDNIILSKVRKSIRLDVGTSYQTRIVSMKVL